MNRTALTYIISSLVVGSLIFGARRISNPTHIYTRTITSDAVQGILVGIGLAFSRLLIIGNAYITKVNGWTTMFGCGEPRRRHISWTGKRTARGDVLDNH